MTARKFDVFLSYHNRDQQVVENLATQLADRGLKPWLDIWNLVPGEAWQPKVEKALDKCLACAVCVGAAGLGPWQSEEMRAAINRRVRTKDGSFRVIPVLLPGRRRQNGLPAFLASSTWVEFRRNIDDKAVVERLVNGIRGRVPVKLDPSRRMQKHPRVEMSIRVSGTPEQFRKVTNAVQELLRKTSGDATLTIKYVRPGSVIVVIDCMEDAFRRLESLFRKGQLRELAGCTVHALESSQIKKDDSATRIVPLAKVDKETILSVLERLNGDKQLTARSLGIGKTTLYRRLREYGIPSETETRNAPSVFLAHNSKDERIIEEIAELLRRRRIRVWFDKWILPPGRPFQEEIEKVLRHVNAIAVFIGGSGLGRWERMELRATIGYFDGPVIPVLLPGAPSASHLPPFLREFSAVRFATPHDLDALTKLIWGITGIKPSGKAATRRMEQR